MVYTKILWLLHDTYLNLDYGPYPTEAYCDIGPCVMGASKLPLYFVLVAPMPKDNRQHEKQRVAVSVFIACFTGVCILGSLFYKNSLNKTNSTANPSLYLVLPMGTLPLLADYWWSSMPMCRCITKRSIRYNAVPNNYVRECREQP